MDELRTVGVWEGDLVLAAKNGDHVAVHNRTVALRDAGGRITGYQGVSRKLPEPETYRVAALDAAAAAGAAAASRRAVRQVAAELTAAWVAATAAALTALEPDWLEDDLGFTFDPGRSGAAEWMIVVVLALVTVALTGAAALTCKKLKAPASGIGSTFGD